MYFNFFPFYLADSLLTKNKKCSVLNTDYIGHQSFIYLQHAKVHFFEEKIYK